MFEYQTNWNSWKLPWHTAEIDDLFEVYHHYAGFGPFQFRWMSMTRYF